MLSETVLRNLIPLALLFVICDIPWLYLSSSNAQQMIKTIQGGLPIRMRWEGTPPVYLALAFLVQQAHSTADAFFIGLSTYAVYDFTNYATLAKYDLSFAIADSVWGGVLFSIVREVAILLHVL
jgi:uncharacterized membrane protein